MAESNDQVTDQQITAYLKDRKALLVDFSTSRQSIRRLLNQAGMKGNHIQVAESFEEACAQIKLTTPQIIFSEYVIGKKNGLELFQLQKEALQDRQECSFFVISDKNSEAIASHIAEEDVDGLIVRPFTFGDLQSKFFEVISSKLKPSPILQQLGKISVLVKQNQVDQALALIETAKKDPSASAGIYYVEAGIHLKRQTVEKALAAFEGGLKLQPTHFKCLGGLLELRMETGEYAKAYEVATILAKHYPVSPKRIPTLVRLSVLNARYEDVLNYYEVFKRLDETDELVSTYIAAGMVICAKYFLRKKDSGNALSAFKTAQAVCRGKTSIMREIIQSLLRARMIAESEAALKQMSDDFKATPEFYLLDFQCRNLSEDPVKVFQSGVDLIRKGIRDAALYEVLIQRALELNRKPEVIQTLVSEAMVLFPERSERFVALATPKPAPASESEPQNSEA